MAVAGALVQDIQINISGATEGARALADVRKGLEQIEPAARRADQGVRQVERSMQSSGSTLSKIRGGWDSFSTGASRLGEGLGKVTFAAQALTTLLGGGLVGALGGAVGALVSFGAQLFSTSEEEERAAATTGALTLAVYEYSAAAQTAIEKAKNLAKEQADAGQRMVARLAGISGVDQSQLAIGARLGATLEGERVEAARQRQEAVVSEYRKAVTEAEALRQRLQRATDDERVRWIRQLSDAAARLKALRGEYERLGAIIGAQSPFSPSPGGGGGGRTRSGGTRTEAGEYAPALFMEAIGAARAFWRDVKAAGDAAVWRDRRDRGDLPRLGEEFGPDNMPFGPEQETPEQRDLRNTSRRAQFGGVAGEIEDLASSTGSAAAVFNASLSSMTQAMGQFLSNAVISGAMSAKELKRAIGDSIAATSAQLYAWSLALLISAPFAAVIPGLGPGLSGTMLAGSAALAGGATTLALLARGMGAKPIGGAGGGGGGGAAAASGGGGNVAPAAMGGGGGSVTNVFNVSLAGAVLGRDADVAIYERVQREDMRRGIQRGAQRIGGR